MHFSAFLFIFLFAASTVHAAHQPLLMILRFADFLRALFGRAGAGLQHVPSRASLNSGLSFRSASSRLAVAPDVGPGIGRAAEVAARAAAGRAAEAADRVGAGAARAAEVAGRAAAGRVVGPGARAGIRTLPRIGTKTKVGGGLIVGGGAGKLVDDFFLDKKENEAERNISMYAYLSIYNFFLRHFVSCQVEFAQRESVASQRRMEL